MRPEWRLAISSVRERRSRSMLMIVVIMMAAMLIAAVGVALGSLRGAVAGRVESMVGTADVRIRPSGRGATLQESALERVRSWPEVAIATPKLESTPALRFVRPLWTKDPADNAWLRTSQEARSTTRIDGVDTTLEPRVRRIDITAGRLPTAPDEIALDGSLVLRLTDEKNIKPGPGAVLSLFARTGDAKPMKASLGPERVDTQSQADALNAQAGPQVGDTLEAIRFRKDPIVLKIVGILAPPPLGGSPRAIMTVDGLQRLTETPNELSQIDVVLKDGTDAAAFVEARSADPSKPLGDRVQLQTTEKVTSGLNRNLQANQLAFVVASMLSFLAAGFIIMTGMATAITEKQRELAVLRCIGAERWQLARSQLFSGLILGVIGAGIGVPLGVLAASLLVNYYHDKLQTPPVIEWWRLAMAFGGAVFAGVIGAAWPAWQASRVSPLQALAIRSVPPKRRTFLIICGIAAIGIAVHLANFLLISDPNTAFWVYIALGLPGLMLGYFFLGVPLTLAVNALAGPIISKLLKLPSGLLTRGIAATPFRFGFTSGAMMAGLALMVAIWTQGTTVISDWLTKVEFPDAFVVGINMKPQAQEELNKLPFVERTSSISMYPVETDSFGLEAISSAKRLKTFFIAFEPDSFFAMSKLNWVQGDPEVARKRLNEGGAIIVSREFLTARGLGVGSTWRCWDEDKEFTFEIVGVVTSPGLEMVGDIFDVGQDLTEQRLHSVFGSRKDLKEKFNTDAIGLIQLTLDPKVPDEEAMPIIRNKMMDFGVINAGSGRALKFEILKFVKTTLLISSSVAIFAMFVACFGVANLIVAGVQARQFEFGVLRSIGASPGLIIRLVMAEAIIIAISASILGTCMGIQGAFGGVNLDRMLWGLDLTLRPPIVPILAGCGFVFLMTLGAALPAALSVGRKRPRELLAATRG